MCVTMNIIYYCISCRLHIQDIEGNMGTSERHVIQCVWKCAWLSLWCKNDLNLSEPQIHTPLFEYEHVINRLGLGLELIMVCLDKINVDLALGNAGLLMNSVILVEYRCKFNIKPYFYSLKII